MNFKDRGITVGDLLLITIIIFSSIFIARNFNQEKETTLRSLQEDVAYLRRN